jgi:hypothetical protein
MQRPDGSAGDSGLRVVVEGHPDRDADPEGDQDGGRGEQPAGRRAAAATAGRAPLDAGDRAHEA